MKLKYFILLAFAGASIFAQSKSDNSKLNVYTSEMFYNETDNEWTSVKKVSLQDSRSNGLSAAAKVVSSLEDASERRESLREYEDRLIKEENESLAHDEELNYAYKTNAEKSKRVKKGNEIYFPEGFSMKVPENMYTIVRKDGKYSFYHKHLPDETANFDVYVTDFDLQASITGHNYFLVSKNGDLGLYGVYRLDEKSEQRIIVGFRLFYTLALSDNRFVTVRSVLFKEHDKNQLYASEIVNVKSADAYLASY